MNDSQRMMIKQLRAAGLGYKEIGKRLNLSKESVHTFCRRNGLSGYAKQMRLCRFCGSPIYQTDKTKTRIFCSNSCKDKYRYMHNKQAKANEE